MGFAPPPHDGFAFLASAHTDAHDCKHIPDTCYECTIHCFLDPRNNPWRITFAEGCCPPVALLNALSHTCLISRGR
jgi:hypothetical protein